MSFGHLSILYNPCLFINMRAYINVFPDVGSFVPFGLSWVVLLQGEWASCVRREAKERFCHSYFILVWFLFRGGRTPYPFTVNFSCSSLPTVSVLGPGVCCLSEECCVLQCCWYRIRRDDLINGVSYRCWDSPMLLSHWDLKLERHWWDILPFARILVTGHCFFR